MIKVHIDNAPYRNVANVWIIKYENKRNYILRWSGKEWICNEFEEGSYLNEPSISFPYPIATDVFKAMIDAISDQGIKPDAYSVLEGEIKATKYHLEDMRNIVFKTNPLTNG